MQYDQGALEAVLSSLKGESFKCSALNGDNVDVAFLAAAKHASMA